MKKNAFTLVELIAVLVILSIILTIVATNVLGVFEDSKENAYDTQIEMIKTSIKDYVTENKRSLFSESNTTCVTLGDLLRERYIEKIPEDIDGKRISENLGYVAEKDEITNKITYTFFENINTESKCN